MHLHRGTPVQKRSYSLVLRSVRSASESRIFPGNPCGFGRSPSLQFLLPRFLLLFFPASSLLFRMALNHYHMFYLNILFLKSPPCAFPFADSPADTTRYGSRRACQTVTYTPSSRMLFSSSSICSAVSFTFSSIPISSLRYICFFSVTSSACTVWTRNVSAFD